MKKHLILLLISLSFQLYYSQKSSSLEIVAPNLKLDTIFVTYPSAARNTHLLHHYKFTVEGSKKLAEQGDMKLSAKGTVKIITNFDYPQPAAISYYDTVKNSGMQSQPFFVESGTLKLLLKDDKLNFELLSSSPANFEYNKLSAILKPYESRLKPYESNDAENLEGKELELQKYIRKNPKSFVALWEIINDFSRYGYHPVYFENLKLFDMTVKKTYTYLEFSKLLKLEAEKIFPDVNLDNSKHLSKETFKNYKLTLIDYWATFCKPCIEDMPRLVELYNQYKNLGVNFISIADEQTPERMVKAAEILKKNNITWESYFDKNKDFPKKLNASGYPLQILVDSEGNIVKRTYGELDVIKEFMTNYLSN
ncbi:TlpA family protein disulfide reductase [Epilithonimonas caeni]|uniref:TlpA family protein disulfide reductase n=1 Tax=Epilithonimonas caeni TaxID=365343 RepID=UPI00146BB512|nr:TlpA disulfide reductase family protein [Epilithonimonas caeni]